MAGEWIAVDACLPTKPETLEMMDRTGMIAPDVVGRFAMVWIWASHNMTNGTARISPRLLARACQCEESFLREMSAVGWLVIDEAAGTVSIDPEQWERRFSTAAKSRALAAARHARHKAGTPDVPPGGASRRGGGATRPGSKRRAPPAVARRALEREREEKENSSSSRESIAEQEGNQPVPAEPATGRTWADFLPIWQAGAGVAWGSRTPPDGIEQLLAEPGWFEDAVEAIRRLPSCRYFRDPVPLGQFLTPGFVGRILAGDFANAPRPRGYAARQPDAPPPARGFEGDDLARFEAARRRVLGEIAAATVEPG